MVRAKHPKAYQMAVGLGRKAGRLLDLPVASYRVVSRIYDRQSGNFKAIGWRIEVRFNDELQTRQDYLLLDEDLPNYIQTTL